MFVPASFAIQKPEELLALIDRHPFGLLVSGSAGSGLDASHVPFRRVPDSPQSVILQAHVARANPQWRALKQNPDSLAVFLGPHAYVSPLWTGDKLAVPTWNYVAVHARGRATVIEDPDRLRAQLASQAAQFEGHPAQGWNVERLGARLPDFLAAIVGIEIEVLELTGQRKLSQNKPRTQRNAITAALLGSGDSLARELGELMRPADD